MLIFEILKDMGKFLEINSSLKVTQEEAEISIGLCLVESELIGLCLHG